MAISGTALASLAVGSLFAYSAVTGKSVLASLYAITKGESPGGVAQAYPITDPGAALAAAQQAAGSGGTGSVPATGLNNAVNASGAVPSGNVSAIKKYAFSQFSRYGWGTDQEQYLDMLWNRESGWSNTIWNGGSHAATEPAGSSGAYGIAQSLPYTKYPKAGWPPGYGGSADAQAQVDWGLAYISSTYHTPQGAWSHEESAGWY